MIELYRKEKSFFEEIPLFKLRSTQFRVKKFLEASWKREKNTTISVMFPFTKNLPLTGLQTHINFAKELFCQEKSKQ